MLAVAFAVHLAASSPAPGQVLARQWLESAPPGPHIRFGKDRLSPSAFRSNDRVVACYYFYWYDDASKAHFIDPDGSDALQDHPVNPKGYSYLSEAWHRRELLDIMDAGIDVILPVYWGNPGDKLHGGDLAWSFQGIPPLVRAARQLRAEGKRPPLIGLFYDTSTLQHNAAKYHADLTTEEGRAWFYVTIRDFFSMVPTDLWATVEQKPLVFLYAAAFAKAGSDDPALAGYLRNHFEKDFGGAQPYLVQEVSWKLPAESSYAWGAAFGLRVNGVAAVGPGYNDSAVPGRNTPIQDREMGAFYRRNWERLLAMNPARRPKIVVVETWNELHEGTDICDTKEFGRLYIDLTRKYARDWKAGARYPRSGPYSSLTTARTELRPGAASGVVSPVRAPDGLFQIVPDGLESLPNEVSANRYLYFGIDDSFFFDDDETIEAEIGFEGPAPSLEYDSRDPTATLNGAYKAIAPNRLDGTGRLVTAFYRLAEARLGGRQNGGADFRLVATPGLRVKSVTLRKVR